MPHDLLRYKEERGVTADLTWLPNFLIAGTRWAGICTPKNCLMQLLNVKVRGQLPKERTHDPARGFFARDPEGTIRNRRRVARCRTSNPVRNLLPDSGGWPNCST